MENDGESSYTEALIIKSGDDQTPQNGPASAHTIGHDTWQQVGLLLTTGFNCGWILSYSMVILVPLGWEWGVPCLIVIALFSAYSNCLLADFHYIDGQRFIRYRDIMRFLFGKEMYYVTWLFQLLTFILTNMGFILLGGKALKDVTLAFSDSTLRLQYFIVITGLLCFLFAIVVPNLSAMGVWLGASAILTFGFIGVLLGAITVGALGGKSNKHKDYEVTGNTVDKVFNAFGAVSAIILSNNSGMLPEIQSTVRRPAIKNMRNALYVQYTAGLLLYNSVTILGYWAYGSEVSDYLPTNLRGPKWAKVLINSAVFLQTIISQHIFALPIHEALDTKFLKFDKGTYTTENFNRRFLHRALFFALNTVVAAAVPFMGDFINLLGSFTLIPLTFLFPSMIFIKVKGKTARAEQKAWHWVIICVFSILAVATTLSALRSIFNNIKYYHLFSDQ